MKARAARPGWLAGLVWLWLMALLPGVAAMAEAGDAPIVIVLSWDGMRHDYPDRGAFPALARMAAEGVRAGRLTPVFPSSTFPGHVSMATGTYPDRHGIVSNEFLDPQRGRYAYSSEADWIDAEPLWIAAERQGVPAATYFWVGSESDWRGQGTRYRIAPFDPDRPEGEKVDQILAWLKLPEAERPRLILSYWAGADRVGHRRGPDSAAVTAQIRRQDAELGRLLAGLDALGLWPRTTLMVVSDHGMTPVTRYLDLQEALQEAGVDAEVLGGAVARIHLRAPVPEAAMRSLLEDFLAGVPGAAAHRAGELPEAWRLDYPGRLGDWVVAVPPPYSVRHPGGPGDVLRRLASLAGWTFGAHGYDPRLADMGGIFLAMGRGVRKDLPLPEVRQIDLAATVAALLNIDPPGDSEGAPIWPRVAAPPAPRP